MRPTLPFTPRPFILPVLAAALLLPACDDDDNSGGNTNTGEVGLFDGLFNDIATGFNFPFDIGIVPYDVTPDAGPVEEGDIFVASYGTSEIMVATDPSGSSGATSQFYAGPTDMLLGAMAVSVPNDEVVWAAFEQGGTNGAGGIVILQQDGTRVDVLDGTDNAMAFANPAGICWGGFNMDQTLSWFFFVNMGDGTAWRIAAPDLVGTTPEFVRVGSGLATGTLGNPGTPGNGITTSTDTPQGGARGCAYHNGNLYVADAQNQRVVRFDGAAEGVDIAGVALEETPPALVTFPTDLSVNADGELIVISFDNAHAFVSLALPSGGFIDNGLHDLNVNAGNYGVAVAADTIWFTRANNQNGALRAVTPAQSEPPTTAGPFPPQ